MSGLVGQLINISPQRSIGGIVAQATVEEVHTDELTITDHPVEMGANISDHAFLRPAEVTIRCGWSNSGGDSLSGVLGGSTGDSYVRSIYQKLRELQGLREPFDLATGKRNYKNMLLVSLSITTDPRTENALMVTATCRQIIIVKTQATTLPPRDSQSMPEKTSVVIKQGFKQPTFGPEPSPGGALKPSQWGVF